MFTECSMSGPSIWLNLSEGIINIRCSIAVQWWLKKFAKETRALKVRSAVAGHQKLTITNWERSLKADPLTTTRKVAEELNFDHSMVIRHLRQIGKIDKWVPHELAKKKKIVILKCCLILFCATTMNHFLIGLWHAAKSGFYTTSHNDQLSDWTERKLQSTSQSQICTKKRSWSLFSGLLPVSSTAAFWIPGKSLHLRSMLSRWMKCTKNHTCSQHWSTERAQFFSTRPDRTSYNQCFKSWMNWAMKFGLIHHIHQASCQLTTTSSSTSTTFCRKNASTVSKRSKMLSKNS